MIVELEIVCMVPNEPALWFSRTREIWCKVTVRWSTVATVSVREWMRKLVRIKVPL